MSTVDVGTILDEGQWSGYQKLLVGATALTIILDGLDNQIIGVAIPAMMREWSLARPAFANVLTSGMLGMMVGGFLGGYIGDRVGRRVALLGSVVAFGVLTVFVSFSTSIGMLTALRFLSGLGLGGAMPNAAAISSEYVPQRQRPFAVTLTIVCIPLGGSLAGLIGGWVLPAFGWRVLFLVAGDATEAVVARASVRELFADQFRRDTLTLWASFFFCLLSVYMGTNWVPAMLTRSGFDVGTASYGLTAFNFGGVVGAILGAIVIMRFGSRLSMLTMAVGAIVGAIGLATMSIGPQSAVAAFVMLAWTGGLINAVQTTMYALAAHVYPTSIRATGVGTAVAFGRIGGVVSPTLGSWALESGGAPAYFAIIAGTMTLVVAALASVRNHIPRRPRAYRVGSVAPAPAGH